MWLGKIRSKKNRVICRAICYQCWAISQNFLVKHQKPWVQALYLAPTMLVCEFILCNKFKFPILWSVKTESEMHTAVSALSLRRASTITNNWANWPFAMIMKVCGFIFKSKLSPSRLLLHGCCRNLPSTKGRRCINSRSSVSMACLG